MSLIDTDRHGAIAEGVSSSVREGQVDELPHGKETLFGLLDAHGPTKQTEEDRAWNSWTFRAPTDNDVCARLCTHAPSRHLVKLQEDTKAGGPTVVRVASLIRGRIHIRLLDACRHQTTESSSLAVAKFPLLLTNLSDTDGVRCYDKPNFWSLLLWPGYLGFLLTASFSIHASTLARIG
jgi:hypothetical protein